MSHNTRRALQALGLTTIMFVIIIGIPVLLAVIIPASFILPTILGILFILVFLVIYKEIGS